MSTNPTVPNGAEDEEFRVFVSLHSAALQASAIPSVYWRSLHHKITSEVWDRHHEALKHMFSPNNSLLLQKKLLLTFHTH